MLPWEKTGEASKVQDALPTPLTAPTHAAAVATAKVDLIDNAIALTLFGRQNENLKVIERRLGVRIGQRGAELNLSGPAEAVALAVRLVEQLEEVVRAGRPVYREDVEQALKVLSRGTESLKDVFLGSVLVQRSGKRVAPKSLNQKHYVESIRTRDIVFGIGPAGTGKTYLAMAMAVSFLQDRKVKRIILCRPAVEAGEKLGFLPGDLAEKINPYLRPLYDALNDMMDPERALQLIEQGTVEVAPLAFMRGRTLNDAFVILDEAQNTTVEQMKMFLTRLGFNSKAVITGDVTQVDLPVGKASGLSHARGILKDIDGIDFILFSEMDVVRHPLVQEVIRAYERSETPPPPQAASTASEGEGQGKGKDAVAPGAPAVAPPDSDGSAAKS